MGKFKLKKLALVMPYAWLTILKERSGIKRNLHPFNKRPSSQGKPFSAHNKKKSPPYYRSSLNHKAMDTSFPSTPKRSSSKACREESSAKQAFCKKLESQLHGAGSSSPGEAALPRSLYKCTMNPASRKICAGNPDHEQISFHTISHDQALSSHPTSCYNNPTKEKNFHLDVQELEAKLRALSSQERLRNLYISPLFSVAVPSPSLDGEAQDYSIHDSLDTFPRYSLEGQYLESRGVEDNVFYEDSSSSIYFSPYSSSSSGTYFRSLDNTQSREVEAINGKIVTLSPNSHDNHHSFGCNRGCSFSRRYSSGRREKKTSLNEVDLGSRLIYTLQVHRSDRQNKQKIDEGRRRFHLLQKNIDEGDIDQTGPVTPNIEGLCLSTLYADAGQSRRTESRCADGLTLSDSELACKNHRRFKMLQREKVSMHVKREPLNIIKRNLEKGVKSHSSTPVHEVIDGLSDAQIQLLKSLSTRSLDSSLSPYIVRTATSGMSSVCDALSSGDLIGDPSFTKSSSKKFSGANQPLQLPRKVLNVISGVEEKEILKGFKDHDAPIMATSSLVPKATSSQDHKSCMEVKNPIAPCMHQDKLHYKRSPKNCHPKSSCMGDDDAQVAYAHQNRPSNIFASARRMPMCSKFHGKRSRLDMAMKLSTCCRSSGCRHSIGVDHAHHHVHRRNDHEDMYRCYYPCPPVDDHEWDSVSYYSSDSSDDTSSDKEVKEHIARPSFSRSPNRIRPLGGHCAGTQRHNRRVGDGHHQYACSYDVELGRCCRTSTDRLHRSTMIRRSPCYSEVPYNKGREASMISRRSCSDVRRNNGELVSTTGRSSCSSKTYSDTAIEDTTSGGIRSCSSGKSPYYNVRPVQRQEDMEERMIGRRSCRGAQSDRPAQKFVEHDKEVQKRVQAEYEKDIIKEVSMIGARKLQRSGGSKAAEGQGRTTQQQRRCSRESNDQEKKCRRSVPDQNGSRDDDVVLQAKVMWSYNMRQDFKESMMDVLCKVHVHEDDEEDEVKVNEELLDLVGCYLALNPPSHHASILYAFGDLCSHLFH